MMRAVRATTAKLIAVSVFVQIAFAGQAAAIPPMYRGPIRYGPDRLSLGVGVAYRNVNQSGAAAFPLELTLAALPFVTVSSGAVLADGGLRHAYFELGAWLGFSVAAGAGFGSYQTPQGVKEGGTMHVFFGIPFPLDDDLRWMTEGKWVTYVEPYYRVSSGPWPGAAHEFGLMMKIGHGLGKGPRPKAR
jgi:hypothetical protein